MESEDQQIIEEKRTDTSETWLWEKYPYEFKLLLLDHSRPRDENGNRHFIIWATDSYEYKGEGYMFDDEITPERITGENGQIIQPRAVKSREEQLRRVKDKAEVFTPSWICNAQNNLIDEAWFGRPNVFNEEVTLEDGTHTWIPEEEKIAFPKEKGKTWKDYVKDMRLEITCGEAPYLASRYDSVSGEPISDLNMRIGLLDRKLRIVSENTRTSQKWIYWAKEALKCTYGYEWLGDNLVLAREALMLTVFEYYRAKFGKEIPKQSVKGLAYIISWNIWQMDGLKYVIPNSCEWEECKSKRDDGQYHDMFEELESMELKECDACRSGKGKHIGIAAKIRDWKEYKKDKNNTALTDIEFRSLLNLQ